MDAATITSCYQGDNCQDRPPASTICFHVDNVPYSVPLPRYRLHFEALQRIEGVVMVLLGGIYPNIQRSRFITLHTSQLQFSQHFQVSKHRQLCDHPERKFQQKRELIPALVDNGATLTRKSELVCF